MNEQHKEVRHPGGWPRIYPYEGLRARLAEAWWTLTGRFTLHRAWQRGYDQHIRDDSMRRARRITPLETPLWEALGRKDDRTEGNSKGGPS